MDTTTNVGGLVPLVGTMSIAGRQRDMEDAISVHTNLCCPIINGCQPIHFFGVFDGHGGSHVAELCRDKLHLLIIEELMRVENNGSPPLRQPVEESEGLVEAWQRILRKCFEKMDQVALEILLRDCMTDDVALTGCTAVVAILTNQHVIVANCGDSRAVLCRRLGTSIPLSVDHKPDREDERSRIEAEGGRVTISDGGGARVERILAMSRAIGDEYLKPYVTAVPEISITERASEEDECLILASDGLWDVITSDTACEVARACLREEPASIPGDNNAQHRREGEGVGAFYPSRAASAASLLARLALGQQSADNISVIVVDLKRSESLA